MIWIKTDAGRAEIQARALVKERAQRNLLLVIDGAKTEEMLLASLAGIGPEDFAQLQALGLIAPAPAAAARSAGGARAASSPQASAANAAPQPAAAEAPAVPLDYSQFTAALTQIISRELGLRGFTLTLAVEKAATIEELRAVADRALTQVRERKGEAAATVARRALYGG